MSFDTISQNKQLQSLHASDEIWVFGYGSLIYKVDFPYLEKTPATIIGWQRRFWQGSHDHRGTPQRPGRVVTLISSELDECSGMAYKVNHDVFDHLDHREKNGYLRYEVDVYFNAAPDDREKFSDCKKGLVYIAPDDNAAFLGHASEWEIAQHIHQSSGPSGHNRDYVFQLTEALRSLGETDEHVFAIDSYLKELIKESN
jgi:cation transport protein ChaC